MDDLSQIEAFTASECYSLYKRRATIYISLRCNTEILTPAQESPGYTISPLAGHGCRIRSIRSQPAPAIADRCPFRPSGGRLHRHHEVTYSEPLGPHISKMDFRYKGRTCLKIQHLIRIDSLQAHRPFSTTECQSLPPFRNHTSCPQERRT